MYAENLPLEKEFFDATVTTDPYIFFDRNVRYLEEKHISFIKSKIWTDWLKQDNEYAIGDRKSMEACGGKYLNFIKIVLRKK